jgi:type 1 fimbria pilin
LNDIGFAGIQNSNVIIGRRNRNFTNDLRWHAINNKMTLNLTARYYWSLPDVKKEF